MKRPVPERRLRIATLLALAVPGPILLTLIDSELSTWQGTLPWALGMFMASLMLVRGEYNPALMDEEPARRAARYSLFLPPIWFALAFLFPYTVSWAALWALSIVQVYFLAFAYVPRVRTMLLVNSTLLALGLTVLDGRCAPLLGVAGLGWILIRLLESTYQARFSISAVVPSRLGRPLLSGLACFLVGGLVFAAAWSLIPPTKADYRQVGLLKTTGGKVLLEDGQIPQPPWFELVALVVIVIGVALWIGHFLSRRRDAGPEEPGLAEEARWAGVLPPRAVIAAGKSDWPSSPRLALIQRYLVHLERLGLRLVPEDTPARLLERSPSEERDPAERLTHLFERARWSPLPVSEADLRAANEAAEAIEKAREVDS